MQFTGECTLNGTLNRLELDGTNDELQISNLVGGQFFNIIAVVDKIDIGENYFCIQLISSGHGSMLIWDFQLAHFFQYYSSSGGAVNGAITLADGVSVVFIGFGREYHTVDLRIYDPVNGVRSETVSNSQGTPSGLHPTVMRIGRNTRFTAPNDYMPTLFRRLMVVLGRMDDDVFDDIAADLYTYHTN